MAMGNTIGKMVAFIRVISSRESDMGMVSGKMKMSNTKVTIDQTKSKVMVSINGRISKSIKDNSKTTIDKGMDSYTT